MPIFDFAPTENIAAHGVIVLQDFSARINFFERSKGLDAGTNVDLRAVGQPRNRRSNRTVAIFGRVDFGYILKLENDVHFTLHNGPSRNSLTVLFVFDDLPGIKAKKMMGAKSRTAVGEEYSFPGFIEHRPNLDARTEMPAAAV